MSTWVVVLIIASLFGFGLLAALIRILALRTRNPRHRR